MAYEHDETIVRRDLELIHDASLSGQRWQATFLAMGWSSDRKYYLSGRDGRSYLVRASDQEVFARKQAEYHILILASRTGISNTSLLTAWTSANTTTTMITPTGASASAVLPRSGTVS